MWEGRWPGEVEIPGKGARAREKEERERERERRGKQGGRGQARRIRGGSVRGRDERNIVGAKEKVNIKMKHARNHGVCEEKDRDSNKEKETDRDWE